MTFHKESADDLARPGPNTSPGPRSLVVIMGVPFDNLNMEEALERLLGFVRSGKPHYVATANVHFVVRALKDPEFMEVVRLADCITPDGMPIVWASRRIGAPLKERVTGADLVPRLAQAAEREGWRVFFLGGEPGVCDEAAARLVLDYPKLDIHCYTPEFNPLLEMHSQTILDAIREVRPHMLFVSLGAGKAEKWIRMHVKRLEVPLCMGVGAAIDFLAGRKQRAPLWYQRHGLEWVHRMFREPWRLGRRYLHDFWFFEYHVRRQQLREWLWRKKKYAWGVAAQLPAPHTPHAGSKVQGRMDASTIGQLVGQWTAALDAHQSLCLDLSQVEYIDSSGVGCLVALEKQARDQGKALYLHDPSANVLKLFKLLRLDGFFTVSCAQEATPSPLRAACIKDTQLEQDGSLTILLAGRIDAANTDICRQALESLLDHHSSAPSIRLNLSNVDFMDSTGLSMLILVHRALATQARILLISGLTGPVRRLFKISKMDRYLRVE